MVKAVSAVSDRSTSDLQAANEVTPRKTSASAPPSVPHEDTLKEAIWAPAESHSSARRGLPTRSIRSAWDGSGYGLRPSKSCSAPDGVLDHLFDHLSIGVRAVQDGSTELWQKRKSAFLGVLRVFHGNRMHLHELTTNQKVAGSSPAERANESFADPLFSLRILTLSRLFG